MPGTDCILRAARLHHGFSMPRLQPHVWSTCSVLLLLVSASLPEDHQRLRHRHGALEAGGSPPLSDPNPRDGACRDRAHAD